MVATQTAPIQWDLNLNARIGHTLAMAALFGGLVTLPRFIDSWQLNGELKTIVTPYTLGCTAEKQKQNPEGEIQQQGCTDKKEVVREHTLAGF